MEPIRIAVIGAGSMATEHIKTFSALNDVKVVGIQSRTRAKAEKIAEAYSLEFVADSAQELYAETKADLVVIAVPELEINSVTKNTFIYPWHVLMEKPAGFDLIDALEIKSFAEQNNANVFVGMNRRFYSSSLALKTGLNEFGNEARFIHVQDQQSIMDAKSIGQPDEVAEKYMYANSIHLIDLICFFCRGEIIKVEKIIPWQGLDTERVISFIEYSSGDKALYEGIWKGPGPWACNVSTVSRRWSMCPLESLEIQNLGERHRSLVEMSDHDKNYKPGFLLQAEAVINAMQGKEKKVVTLDESLKTMTLINRIFDC